MKGTLAIARREILSLFVSPVAYFVITGYVLLAAYFFFNMLSMYNVTINRYAQMAAMGAGGSSNGPNLNQWVIEPYYQTMIVILVFLVPLLTMRVLAEERLRGTFELLMTCPVSVGGVVFGKFIGIALLLFIMNVLIAVFPMLLVVFGDPGPEVRPLLSGFLALNLASIGFASVAMAAGAFTENQIVAGVSGMVSLLLLYVIHAPAESMGGTAGKILEYLSPVLQLRDMFRGVIGTDVLIYFISLISLGIFLSLRALEAQRYR